MTRLRSVAAVLVPAAGLVACENGTDPEDRVPARVEVVDGNAQQGTAGQPLAQPVRVRVVDERGRPVPGQAVNFVVTGGNGTVSVATATTNDEGIAAVQWTLGTSAGAAQTLEARVAGAGGQAIASDPVAAAARAGAPAKLVPAVPVRPQGGSVGGPALDSLAVRVLDQHDNPVAGADVQWAATEGGGSVSPTRSATDANGVARAQWILGPNGGWIAYDTGIGPVTRRSPGGITQQVGVTPSGSRLRALAPDGSLVYRHPNPDGRYFLAAPDGSLADVGASSGADRIEWRVDRFLLINGGSVYELRP